MTPESDRLRELIESHPRRPSEIARAADLSSDHLYQIRKGIAADPKVSTVGKILRAMGLPWSALDPPKDEPK